MPGYLDNTDHKSYRGSLPIIPIDHHKIGSKETTRLEGIAARLLRNEPALSVTDVFGPGVSSGLTNGPALIIANQQDAGLTSLAQPDIYDYRLSALAGDNDHVVIAGRRNLSFEAYRRDILKLGAIKVHTVAPSVRLDTPFSNRCLEDIGLLDDLAKIARQTGQMTIMPYLGSGKIWQLAMKLAQASKSTIKIAAPPPRLTRRVNDKIWFGQRVIEVLGKQARPSLYSAYGPAALAGKVASLARNNEQVVVKVPQASGSAGNFCYTSKQIRDLSLQALRQQLVDLLNAHGWDGRYPLLVEVWDCAVISSPSAQMWIPEKTDGLPIIEGLFQQVVEGPAGEFTGAVAANLPENLAYQLVDGAFRLAFLFQQLGYFGRCSFDTVLFGKDYANAKLHWIECNGRWGGVSIPMTLANRLTGNWHEKPFALVHKSSLSYKKRSFDEILQLADKLLYRPGRTKEGIVLLTPNDLERGQGLHMIALANSIEAAKALASRATQTLTGTGH